MTQKPPYGGRCGFALAENIGTWWVRRKKVSEKEPMDVRPWRSALYVPASNGRAMEKARELAADAIIFDLEDSLQPDAKPAARETLAAAVAADYGRRAKLVRINGADTAWGAADLSAVAHMPVDAVLLPKVSGPTDVEAAARTLDAAGSRAGIWAMMESPAGVLNAPAIARAPRIGGFVVGTNDLASELRCATRADRSPMITALQTCLMAARAAGIVIVDGVYNALRDQEGLRAECLQGRELGMDGKTVLHPAQIDIVNAVFAPTDDELDLARRQIEAFARAEAEGQGVAVLNGKIVENMHVETARMTIARAEAIRKMEPA
jgi:(3S)-malyl-CoA thioesterase